MARAVVEVSLGNLSVVADGFRRAPEKTIEAVRRAVNRAGEVARTRGSSEMRRQVALTKEYVDTRLKLVGRATPQDLSVIVRGSDRPTSLARFATNRGDVARKGEKSKPAKVRVKAGAAPKTVNRSFLVNLRRGRAETGNIGLAIRLPKNGVRRRRLGTSGLVPFGKPNKKTQAFLVYGPSIDQIFDKTRDEIRPEVARTLERETLRQLDVLGVFRG